MFSYAIKSTGFTHARHIYMNITKFMHPSSPNPRLLKVMVKVRQVELHELRQVYRIFYKIFRQCCGNEPSILDSALYLALKVYNQGYFTHLALAES